LKKRKGSSVGEKTNKKKWREGAYCGEKKGKEKNQAIDPKRGLALGAGGGVKK